MPDRCVEEGGILLVSGTPWPSPRVPIFHSVSHSVSQCPPVSRVACVLAVVRGFFSPSWHGKSIQCPPKSACKSAAIGGSTIPGQGFLLGIAPAGWQNACGDPRVSIPGLAGLACVFPQPWEGHRGSKGPKGLQSSGTDRREEGAPPRALTVRAHRLQSTNGPARRTDGRPGSRIPRQ